MEIKLYRSATVGINLNGFKILQDPWLIDGAYYGSWVHYPTFNLDTNLEEINSYNAIYVSHIHPDHCDDNTTTSTSNAPVTLTPEMDAAKTAKNTKMNSRSTMQRSSTPKKKLRNSIIVMKNKKKSKEN